MPLLNIKYHQRKSWLNIFIVLLCHFSLVACGGGSSDSKESSQSIHSSPTETLKKYSGVVQKGPFVPDSTIYINQLSKNGKTTNTYISTSTSGTAGSFQFNLPQSWESDFQPIELTASGLFLDESSGDISSVPVTLNALLSEPANSSINVLTHWLSLRTKVLLHQNRLSLSKALKHAAYELETATGIGNANQLDISQNEIHESDSAQLLLLSGALLDVSREYETSQQVIINQIGADFAENGDLNQQGKKWFKRIQSTINNDPDITINRYGNILSKHSGTLHKVPTANSLPNQIAIAAKPQAIAPEIIYAQPSETVTLDGSESHDSGDIINSTWFRIDQQSQFIVPLSDRFSDSPTIIVPNQECELLFALIVTDEEKLTDTTVVKVIVRLIDESNESPVPNSQTVVTFEDTPIDIVITANDPDNDNLDFDVGNTPLLLRHGVLEGDAPKLKYTPAPNYFGEDSFNFTASDNVSTSEQATIGITVLPVNDKPIADPQSVITNQNTAIAIGLTGSDIENDPLSFNLVSSVSNGTLDTSALPEVLYTPNTDFIGSDQFIFVANDGTDLSETATVDITVLPINGRPFAHTQSLTTPQTVPINIFLRGTDFDGDDLTYTVLTTPNNGSLSGIAPNLTYHPNVGYTGLDSFTFKVNDGLLDSNISNVSIRVIPREINRVPTANPLSVSTELDTPVSILLTGTDPDGDSLTYTLFSTPGNGTLTGNAPNLSYQPNAGFAGSNSFFFAVNDGKALSSLALVDITVNPIENIPPTAVIDGPTTVFVNEIIKLDGSASSDPDGTIVRYDWTSSTGETDSGSTVSFVAPSAPGVISISLSVEDDDGAVNSTSVTIQILDLINQPPTADAGVNQSVITGETVNLMGSGTDPEDGTTNIFEWTSPAGITLSSNTVANPMFEASNPGIFILSLIVRDSQNLASAPDTVEITISPSGLPPIADAGDNQAEGFNGEVNTIFLDGTRSRDPDGLTDGSDLIYSWSVVSSPVSISLNDGNTATPSFDISTAPVTIILELTVTDTDGLTDTDTVTVNILEPPRSRDQTLEIDPFNPVPITLFGFDPDGDSGSLIYRIVDGPQFGILNNTGTSTDNSFEYISFSVPVEDSFTYQIEDSDGLFSSIATITLTVPNAAPIADPLVINGFSTAETFNVSGSDPDGNTPITFELDPGSIDDVEVNFNFSNFSTTGLVVATPKGLPVSGNFRFFVRDSLGKRSDVSALVQVNFN